MLIGDLGEQSRNHLRQALEILAIRDQLEQTLRTYNQIPAPLLQKLHRLDEQLRKDASRLTRCLDLPGYRTSHPRPHHHWWWHLDTLEDTDPWDLYNWLIQLASLLLWTVNLGSLSAIIARFLLQDPTLLGAIGAAFSSLLTAIKARSELTTLGQKGFEKLLDHLQIPDHYREEAKLLTTLLLTLGLVIIWFSRPVISAYFNHSGLRHLRNEQRGSAENDFLRAVNLNPDNAAAHYNLGDLYEQTQRLEQAQNYYLIAHIGGLTDATNNLARLYILSEQSDQYCQVASLLSQALKDSDVQDPDPEVRYSLYKNLGWLRLRQGEYTLAEQELEEAITIFEEDSSQQAYFRSRGSAYCLMAQTLEELDREKDALDHWESCCQYASSINPEEDEWIRMARSTLEKEKRTCEQP